MKDWKIIVGIIFFITVFAGVYFFTGQNKVNIQTLSSSSNTREFKGDAKEFSVTGENYKFTPQEIHVKKGEKVRITFTNTLGFHDFRIDGLNIGTKQIDAGNTEIVELVADKAGVFEYFCSVGNHREQGMIGKLVVE